MLERFTTWMFRWRTPLIAVFAALTAVMAYFAVNVRVDASFNKSLPREHPYIQTFTKHQGTFGGANRVLVALVAKRGDMFNEQFFRELKRATDEVTFLPSIDRAQVQSLFTPNVRYIEVVEDGFTGGNVIPGDFTPTPANFATVRENIIKSGKLGQLVANDFTGAIVSAPVLEIDPNTGEKVDYVKVARGLERIRDRIAADTHGEIEVHIIGFAKVIGDVTEGAYGVMVLFGVAVVVTALLVWRYAGRWKLAAAPIVASLVAVVWQLGALTALGYGIDTFSILVPFLVFAIGVSHGVQKICTFRNEMFKGSDGPTAARAAFMQLILPGIVALCTDIVGFATMLVIKIQTIRELAITASLGVSVIIITNFYLLPLMLSYLRLPESYARWVAGQRAWGDRLCEQLAHKMKPRPSLLIIVVALALGLWGLSKAEDVRIGDTQVGVPELKPDSRYNRDTALITSKFSIGVDILQVMVETVPNGCVDHEVMTLMDQFEGRIRALDGVQSVISIASVAKTVNAGYSEGSLKWRVLPRNEQALAQAVSPVETSTGLLNSDGSVLPIMIFLRDHKAETLRAVTDAVKAFQADHSGAKAKFVLASGNAGVMAATNEVVAAAERPILYWVFGAVVVLCLLTFRSLRAALCIVTPLVIVSFLAYALMAYLNIGLKTSTLPMLALGIGIGVDYGIYIFARLQASLKAGEYFEDATVTALKDAGTAVVFTGLTLAIGVSSWLFSNLKFQADMGLLLTFMFLVNMVGAIVLMPAIARWFWRHHTGHTAVPFPMRKSGDAGVGNGG
ncbi:MMPL family transporter [Opitutus sp. ER46]|uniref:efflux RND transporter permease subunit n=1 Tax=Opitutus sp. ER46 TaxID=2161864 RepID=UPI000D326AF9|nr:MMPL family transporter [Opitutus sp. ER46]PTX94305.1 RND transporter [Opitutus sp. ER46]